MGSDLQIGYFLQGLRHKIERLAEARDESAAFRADPPYIEISQAEQLLRFGEARQVDVSDVRA